MQARGRTCFLQHTKNTTQPKVKKGAPKIKPQKKHTNTTAAPKCNLAPRDDDTRLLHRPRRHSAALKPLHGGLPH